MSESAEALVDQNRTTQGRPGPRVAIVGGGISGLAAAYRLHQRDPRIQVTVWEAGPRPGGVLQTIQQDGFLIEASADSFITNVPWGLDLCRTLGLEDRLIQTAPTHRRAFVVSRGRLVPIPDGLMIMAPSRIWPMATTPILSPLGKLRMVWERFVRPGDGADESLASFVRRRFGREAYERLIQPLVGGMYTGDPERLSVRATMPRFVEMEQNHGSLIRAVRSGMKKEKDSQRPQTGSGARYSLFAGLKGGMAELVEALVRQLPPETIRTGCQVESLARDAEGRWHFSVNGAPAEADAVILATPARSTGRLLVGVDEELAGQLERIPSTSCAIASLGYRREQVAHPLDGFGFVVPLVERLPILSGSFSSVKFAGRAPDGCVLMRVFLGGASRPDLLDLSDEEIFALAHRELARMLGIQGVPIHRNLSRWREVMPQYQVGHVELVQAIESRVAALPGLALAGNAYHGVGVPVCIHNGMKAADRVADGLGIETSGGASSVAEAQEPVART